MSRCNFSRACSHVKSRVGRATSISAIVFTATLMSGGFTPASATSINGGSAPATAPNLLSPRDSSGSTNVPSAWVVNGSGSATYNWQFGGAQPCDSGSGNVSWTARQVGASFFRIPSLGAWGWSFQVNADIDGHRVTSGAILTWPGSMSRLEFLGTGFVMAAINSNCRGLDNINGLSAITDAMMGTPQAAPTSSKMKCKRKTTPTTTLPNTSPPKWVCTISTGSSLVFGGGGARTSSAGGYSGHWTLTVTQGHAKKAPTVPKPTATKTSLDFGFNAKPAGILTTSPVCVIQPSTLTVYFAGLVQGSTVGLQIHLIGKTGPGTYTIAPLTVASALFMSPAHGRLSGTGTITIAADERSGSIDLAFKDATGTETIRGTFGCATT